MKGLKSRWKIAELGEISTILGMKVTIFSQGTGSRGRLG